MLDTLPERLALARTESLPYADFLTLLLSDEVDPPRPPAPPSCAPAPPSSTRACARHLQQRHRRRVRPTTVERTVLTALPRRRPRRAVLGPVGVGKTHLATALGHVAIRRRRSVLFTRADQLFRQLKAARLDNSVEAEMRRLTRVELLIIDDFALQPWANSRPPTSTN